MNKLLSNKSNIKVEEKSHHPWIYEFSFDVTSDNGLKTRIFAGISGEDLYGYLNWSQDKDDEKLTEGQLNQWRDSVIEKYLNGSKECKSDVCFYAHKNNKNVLDFLYSSLKQ